MCAKNRGGITPQIHIGVNGYSRVDDVENVRKAIHEDVEIKCFYEGTSTLLVNTQAVKVKAGDVVVINPYELHATIDRGPENEPGKYHLFMVPLDFFGEGCPEELDLRALCYAQKKTFRTKISDQPELYRLLMHIAREYQGKEPGCQAAIRGMMMQVFVLLLRNGVQEDMASATPGEAMRAYYLIEPALRYIRDNYSRAISVEELASLCQVSKHYFCRVFKKAMGKSAIEYLQAYRLMIADIMLMGTDNTIYQIAAGCGFESPNYFCRCYKKHFGTTPGKRRNQ